ncbi:type II secretion system F family protein [Pelosinus sp. UFO1]|uniref:type II secretion system F family protein n=1 Tax=Pelosinus sp. UFO1 TaxID=484770 RepID=UPI0004D12268|nr:type II secretion system F family protein [Pelosinus sp. UFO1]AIF51793.1 Type II secretion system F domain-containing protein [Pelosinus sp. UFO1]
MARNFAYRAKDRNGQVLTGSILAENEHAVALHVREKGYFITQLKEEGSTSAIRSFIDNLQRISLKEISIFCRLFSTMIDAGLPLVSCLNVLIEQTDNPRMKKALQDVYKKVKEGETLSRSLGDHPRIFPGLMINMVEAGEVGGVLDDVLGRLANHFEKEHKMNEKIKSALTYPAVVSAMAVLSVVFILTFVLPTFVQMFDNMKMELPLLTRILLAISAFLRNYAPFLLIAVIAGVYGFKIAYQREDTQKYIDALTLKIPIVGMLSRKVGIARFSRTLSTLLHGGVSIITALEVVQKTIGNLSMTKALEQAQSGIKEGMGLATTLAQSKVFTPMVIQMVSIGEESGALDKMLEKIADFYENDVDDVISRLSSIIEPVIIGVLGVVIGLIVISIMIPLFDVITNFSNV